VAQPVVAQRDYYIDRLRSVMTVLVILHHTAITYGGSGGWFWRELEPSAAPSSILLTWFVATNQAYFMGFFFLLAGYFTPASLERKGYWAFLKDRFCRLGLPLLFFLLVLGPVTAAIASFGDGRGFWPTIQFLWDHKRLINGPLWFAEALLIFALGYCGWRAAFGAQLDGAKQTLRPVPSQIWWWMSAIGTAAAALAIRQFVPVGQNIFGLQLGYFSGYIFLFALGIAAWRYDWIRQLQWKNARPWIITLVIAWPTMAVSIFLARVAATTGGHPKANFGGGLSWQAVLYAVWEPLVAWGLICLWLLVFRARMNQPSAFWDWLNRRAYAVYIIHPPVLVGVALLLHAWVAPALAKFGVTGCLTCAACWLISDPIVRLPGVRRIV
jgi:fucose 4-O-acetylase-like acetyltransferase